MAPCPLQRDGRAPHRARSTTSFVPILRPGSRPAFAVADASVCHGASRSLPHVRRRDRDGVYFGQPTRDRTTHRHSQPTPAQPVCPSPKHQPPRNNQADQTLRRNPSLIRCYSVRPIFLGSCVLAVKVSRDADPRLSSLHSCVQDVFNLLDVTLLSRIEHQLLEVLSSQPAPIAPQPARPRISLPHSLCAPMRCRCWTGECPWTPGNIKSTPTRSSARQRTRSSRRPCRTRARRGKLDGPLYRSVGRRVHVR